MSKEDPAIINIDTEVILPMYSFGACRQAKKCKNFQEAELGNGLCVDCYDSVGERADEIYLKTLKEWR
tara:strand:- start:651 stop:854 length:204 start_codon:yes stop_codon:yes gene_type:complete